MENEGELAIAGHLRGCYNHEWNAPELVLFFDHPLKGQVGILQDDTKKSIIDQALNTLFGEGVSISYVIGEDPARLEAERKERLMWEQVESNPIVQLTKEIFHAKIVSITKGGGN